MHCLCMFLFADKNSCKQRKGRCGRVGPGRYMKLVPQAFFNKLKQEAEPEMLRSPLEKVHVPRHYIWAGLVASRLESRLPNESTIYPLFCSCCLTPSFWTSGPRKKYWLSRWALPRKTLSSTLSWNWRRPGQSCPQSRGRHKDTTVISRCWGRSSHTFHSELGKRSDHSQFHHDLENYPCARFCTASAATMLRKSKGSCLLVRV